jgi:hypothetical protein
MYMFFANVFCFLLPRQVALTTEAWQGAESRRRSAENVCIDLPRPPNFEGKKVIDILVKNCLLNESQSSLILATASD